MLSSISNAWKMPLICGGVYGAYAGINSLRKSKEYTFRSCVNAIYTTGKAFAVGTLGGALVHDLALGERVLNKYKLTHQLSIPTYLAAQEFKEKSCYFTKISVEKYMLKAWIEVVNGAPQEKVFISVAKAEVAQLAKSAQNRLETLPTTVSTKFWACIQSARQGLNV